MSSNLVAEGVIQVPAGIANAYLIGDENRFVLVDSGTQGNAENIIRAAEEHFGSEARPELIVLTHGHFDHSGSAQALAEHWRVDVLAHPLEHPYLDGRDSYPPADPTVGGFMAQVIRFVPIEQPNLSRWLEELDPGDEIPGMEDWEIIETPGHSPGHVSFFRPEDGTLIAGDAFCTMNQDSAIDAMTRRKVISRPPSYYTIDWNEAERSVRRLARLRPMVLAAGHGVPMSGEDALGQLRELAKNFPIPDHGRYVPEPARANEEGIVYLPPPAADPVKWTAIGVGAATVAGLGVHWMRKHLREEKRVEMRRVA